MKTVRVASYTSLYKVNISRIEKCKLKVCEGISEPSCSQVKTSQEISDIPLGDSCNSDFDMALYTERPKKRTHKRAVKIGVSLFLPADFLKDDRLVAPVKKSISFQMTY